MNKKDWDFILELRNDPKTRKNFYHQHKISKKEHYRYLEKQQLNPKFFNWIICNGTNQVGYIRVLENDISIMIAEKFRNKGWFKSIKTS